MNAIKFNGVELNVEVFNGRDLNAAELNIANVEWGKSDFRRCGFPES